MIRSLLLATVVTVLLLGCSTPQPTKQEIVYVDRPIPVIPPPPVVPIIPLETATLTASDAATPGVVGRAYVRDLIVLKTLNEILRDIVEQYRTSSTNFEEIEKRIKQLQTPE